MRYNNYYDGVQKTMLEHVDVTTTRTLGTLRDDVKTCTHLTTNNPPAEPSSRRIPLYL